MRELTEALEIVLMLTITLGLPVGVLFVVACLIHHGGALRALVLRLAGRAMREGKASAR